MKKKEIVELINLRKKYLKSEELTKFRDYMFPNIPGLKEEFDVLKKEYKAALIENKEALENSKNISCSHDVRNSYHGLFFSSSRCSICGKSINGNNCSNGTIYNDINRNRYYASFDGSYEDEDEGFIKGIDEEEIHEYIFDILKEFNDNDEVDLVSEFKKKNYANCIIHEEPYKQEYYILIIGGANRKILLDGSYITSINMDISLELAHYFSGIPKINMEVLDNPEIFTSQKCKEYFPYQYSNQKLQSYYNYEELIKEINSLAGSCPFDLIINTSNIADYTICDGDISKKEISLELEKLFPNSFIVNISNNQRISQIELLKKLKENISFCDMAASYGEGKIYSISEKDNNIVEDKPLEKFCDEIKVKIFKKNSKMCK